MVQKNKTNEENPRSDNRAVRQCREWLLEQGKYDSVDIIHKPTDIVCRQKDGRKVYVEVKMTTQEDYFGAATLTEWKQVFAEGADLLFVVAKDLKEEKGKRNGNQWDYDFYQIAPEDFYQISTVPPFKVNFNIKQKEFNASGDDYVLSFEERKRRKDTIGLNNDILKLLVYVYETLKDEKSIRDLLKYFEKLNSK